MPFKSCWIVWEKSALIGVASPPIGMGKEVLPLLKLRIKGGKVQEGFCVFCAEILLKENSKNKNENNLNPDKQLNRFFIILIFRGLKNSILLLFDAY